MSDIMSVTSSDSDVSFSDSSVCDEIGQLLERCEELHEHIHNSFETLQNINTLVKNSTNIMVKYNDSIMDFDEVLEQVHKKVLGDIKEKGVNTFGERLVSTIDICFGDFC
jgi:methyl-accepting chemotaxis protein